MSKLIDKNYGSIAHLSTSKLTQQADKKIHFGQEKLLTEKTKTWKDLIIVTEKVDGSNIGVIKKNKELIGINRSGYNVRSSPYEHHNLFQLFIDNNLELFSWLPEGWRVAGEWCAMAHGIIYDITNESPFIAFDIFDENNKRVPFMDFYKLCSKYNIPMVRLIHIGQPISIKNSIKLLDSGEIYGKTKEPEGVVYKLETEGKFIFAAKWVRSDKEDGKYMKDEIFNKGFDKQYKI